mmetsp:Transcript_73667/g.140149  ORF Transcript_73667/g.140149 Transcript_73667/m.140149 type:complete len:230 (-) Transcript_73667:940-1629(-)
MLLRQLWPPRRMQLSRLQRREQQLHLQRRRNSRWRALLYQQSQVQPRVLRLLPRQRKLLSQLHQQQDVTTVQGGARLHRRRHQQTGRLAELHDAKPGRSVLVQRRGSRQLRLGTKRKTRLGSRMASLNCISCRPRGLLMRPRVQPRDIDSGREGGVLKPKAQCKRQCHMHRAVVQVTKSLLKHLQDLCRLQSRPSWTGRRGELRGVRPKLSNWRQQGSSRLKLGLMGNS